MDTAKKWKVITIGAAITGIGFTGVAVADSSSPIADGSQIQQITVDAFEDLSPESADSPNESVAESADSPFDSPDDPGFVDPSPESADSPNESANDSPAPAPVPQPGNGGGGDDSPGRGGGGGGDDSSSGASVDSVF